MRLAAPATTVPGGLGLAEADGHLLDRLYVLYKYRKLMTSIMLLALGVSAVQTYASRPAYLGTTVVRAEPASPTVAPTPAASKTSRVVGSEEFMQSELRVIQSRDLKRRVVRKLRLDQDPQFATPLGSLEGSLAALRDRLVKSIQTVLRSWRSPAAVAPPTPEPRETPAEARAIDTIAANLQIQPRPASHLFAINFSSSSPEVSANVANALAAEYTNENLAQRHSTIVEYAQPLQRPYRPHAARNTMIALAIGLAIGLLLALRLDFLDDTIKTPEDVTRKLHVPFLGLVPLVRGDREPVLSGPVPHDFGEAYRALRTSLVFTSGAETTHIMTVTSAQPLEGKTTTACNLALVLAFGGSRVLLIDADMRNPGVHKALKMANTVGLSHLLAGQARVREAIQRTNDPNFCVMTAGRTPANPSETLASERMRQLVANLKQGPFDWVVLDTPPVLAATDAVILTPLVDGVTFVLGAEMTRRRLAERAIQMLMMSRPKVFGTVLNHVNFDRHKYYYSQYFGSHYQGSLEAGRSEPPARG